MKALELSGLHIPLKVRITYRLQRKNAKLHTYEGYLLDLRHNSWSERVFIRLGKSVHTHYSDKVLSDVPYYAEVEVLE